MGSRTELCEVQHLSVKLRNAERGNTKLREVNSQLYTSHKKAVKLLREILSDPRGDSTQALEHENEILRLQNQHLRDILLLANYDFSAELVHESMKNCASEASSFLLTTPPRSPVNNNRNNTKRHQSASRSAASSPTRLGVSSMVSVRLQAPTLFIDDFMPDVADVGPPMSPPPNAPPRPISPPQPPTKDQNDLQDAQEAQEGAEEVDHDLSI